MNRIKDVLECKGIKQKWLAEQLGKSYNMIKLLCPESETAKLGGFVQNCRNPRCPR